MHAEDASDVLGSRVGYPFRAKIRFSFINSQITAALADSWAKKKLLLLVESCLENRSPSECSAYLRPNDWKLMVRSSFHNLVSRRRYFIHKVLRVFFRSGGEKASALLFLMFFLFSSSLSTSLLRSFLPQTHTFCPEHSPLPSVTRSPGMKIKFKNGSVVKQSPKAKKIKRSQGIWLLPFYSPHLVP